MAPTTMYLVKFLSDFPVVGVCTVTLRLNFYAWKKHPDFNILSPRIILFVPEEECLEYMIK